MIAKNTEQFQHLAIYRLVRGKYQPRKHFDETALHELAASIKANGIIEPIVVRPVANNQYEIIAGERRWRAAQLVSLDTVPCIIRQDDDESTAAITLIENIQRADLNPLEEAQSYQRLLHEFQYTHEELAEILGKPRTGITNKLRLLALDVRVQEYLKQDKLKEGHGRVLAGLALNKQYPLATQCVEKEWSVRKLEQAIKQAASHTALPHQDSHYRHFERHLGDQLGTEVRIEPSDASKGGYLKIKYFDAATLSGLLERMGVKSESE